MMNIAGIYHEAKSKYAYAYDEETVHLRLRTAKGDVDRVRVIYGDPFHWASNEQKEAYWVSESDATTTMTKEYSTEIYDYYFIAVQPRYKRMKYSFILEKGEERLHYGCRLTKPFEENKKLDLFNFFNFPFINKIDIFQTPEWAKQTIWYQIFPERFCNGDFSNDPKNTLPWGSVEKVRNDQFFGGDLEGVIQKLDYIKNLGATGIYFTPIFKSPSTHKYDTEDYFAIDPQFGDLDAIKRLVHEAHKRGIRVMLDAVFNHCGWNHPFFQDVIKNGEESPYKDFFHIKTFPAFEGDPRQFHFKQEDSELNFHSFAFTPFMPKWNTENPQVKEYLLKAATYWIETCDIDAWRLDVSNEVDHQFWKDFRRVCDETKANFFIVGENWDDANPWLTTDQMHSVMNYQFLHPMWRYFGDRTYTKHTFMASINEILTLYPKHIAQTLFNLLDSHDTTRFLTIAKGNKERLKLAWVFLLTYTGSPSIYYGDEIGLEGEHDPDNRRCMIWEEAKQDLDLFDHLKRLIALRKIHPSFRNVDIQWVEDQAEGLLIYEKKTGDEHLIVLINNSNSSITTTHPSLINQRFHDLYCDSEVVTKDQLLIEANGFRLYLK